MNTLLHVSPCEATSPNHPLWSVLKTLPNVVSSNLGSTSLQSTVNFTFQAAKPTKDDIATSLEKISKADPHGTVLIHADIPPSQQNFITPILEGVRKFLVKTGSQLNNSLRIFLSSGRNNYSTTLKSNHSKQITEEQLQTLEKVAHHDLVPYRDNGTNDDNNGIGFLNALAGNANEVLPTILNNAFGGVIKPKA